MYRGRWWLRICPVCKCRPQHDELGQLTNPEAVVLFLKDGVNLFCSDECVGIFAAIDAEWFN